MWLDPACHCVSMLYVPRVACTVSRITRYVADYWQRWIYWSERGNRD